MPGRTSASPAPADHISVRFQRMGQRTNRSARIPKESPAAVPSASLRSASRCPIRRRSAPCTHAGEVNRSKKRDADGAFPLFDPSDLQRSFLLILRLKRGSHRMMMNFPITGRGFICPPAALMMPMTQSTRTASQQSPRTVESTLHRPQAPEWSRIEVRIETRIQ